MNKPHPGGAPTPYAELNSVLALLLAGARDALGDNFVGAYLQGSFAVGDFSPYSDCDFIVAVRRDLDPAERFALTRLHEAIHASDHPYWRTGLEGSYAPIEILRRWSTTPRDPPGEPRPPGWTDAGTAGGPARAYPFWYLDHGSKVLIRSEHDNTRVVRWCLRERGVVLAGPPPAELIDPVTPDDLREEVRGALDQAVATGLPMPMFAWQAFWVGLFCRILHTLEVGEVTSKKAAMGWAREALAPEWRGLIDRALALRKGDDVQAAAPADPADVASTQAFGAWCRDWAGVTRRGPG